MGHLCSSRKMLGTPCVYCSCVGVGKGGSGGLIGGAGAIDAIPNAARGGLFK